MKQARTGLIASGREKAALPFKIGSIAGYVPLDADTVREAQRFSTEFFKSQTAIEFGGEDVGTFRSPDWAPKAWLPLEEAKALGFVPRRVKQSAAELVATCGVDPHVDANFGLTACLVLHNDDLRFQQGRVFHSPKAGDWFIFDDGKRHQVRSAPGDAVFLGLILPVDPVPRSTAAELQLVALPI